MRSRRSLALVLAASALLFCRGLAGAPLLEPDEGRYAEIPREMLARGDWIVPHLDGLVYGEKPPLGYWMTAAVYRVAGVSERGARLAPALAAVATVGVTAWLGGRLFGARAGLAAAAMLATTPLFYLFGRLAILDMPLTLWLTLAHTFLWLAWVDGRSRWRVAAGLAMGAALLTKGLVGIVLPVGVLLAAGLVERDRRALVRALDPLALGVAGLLALPWFWAMAARVPGFLDFFFVRHHLARYAVGGKIGHYHPPGFLVPVLVGGALPWSLVLAGAAATGWCAAWRDPARRADRYCAVWLVVVLGFYSLSKLQVVTYVCPIFVPLALAAGHAWWAGRVRRWPVVTWGGVVAATFALAILPEAGWRPLVTALVYRRWWSEADALRPVLATAAAVVLLGTCAAVATRRRGVALGFLAVPLALGLVVVERARVVFPSYAGLGTIARARGAEADRLVVYGKFLLGLPFYARRRVALVGPPIELTFGGRFREGSALLWSERRLVRSWNGRRRLFLVIAPRDWRALAPRLARPASVLAAEHGRVLVGNAPLGIRLPTGSRGPAGAPSARRRGSG